MPFGVLYSGRGQEKEEGFVLQASKALPKALTQLLPAALPHALPHLLLSCLLLPRARHSKCPPCSINPHIQSSYTLLFLTTGVAWLVLHFLPKPSSCLSSSSGTRIILAAGCQAWPPPPLHPPAQAQDQEKGVAGPPSPSSACCPSFSSSFASNPAASTQIPAPRSMTASPAATAASPATGAAQTTNATPSAHPTAV